MKGAKAKPQREPLVTAERRGGAVVITYTEPITEHNHTKVREESLRIIKTATDASWFVVDITGMDMVPSMGISIFRNMLLEAKRFGGRIRYVITAPHVIRDFIILYGEYGTPFPHNTSVTEALNAIKAESAT